MTENVNNPLLTRSTLPYQLPVWEQIKPEHIVPAVKTAIAATEAAWERIATQEAAPTVANTVYELHDAGRQLSEILNIAFTLFSSIGGPELEAAEAEIGPLLSAHDNTYRLDERLYNRLAAIDLSDADAETAHYIKTELLKFEQGGIKLDAADKAKLRELDAAISEAEIAFSQRATLAMSDNEVVFTDAAELEGLSAEQLAAYEQADGTWKLPLDNYTNQPVQAELKLQASREKVLAASLSRGLGEHESSDTRELILRIAKLRAERAALLGYPYHAQAVAAAGMAQDSDAIMELLRSVSSSALAAAKQEAERFKQLAAADGLRELRAADWLFYEAKLRAELGIDESELAPYFELNSVVERGLFFAAEKLYGIRFVPLPELKGYLPSVKTWEVQEADGTPIALFQADFFRRKGKSGGAWMHAIVEGAKRDGNLPVIMNNCNYPEPQSGEPCLLTWDHVITLFHEFGHALHGMFADSQYRWTCGTNVARDFVEAPSQFNEMWAYHPEVVANYAVHYETGEKLPAETVQQLVDAATFGQAFATTEQLSAALVDQLWHRLTPTEVPDDVAEFEAHALRQVGMDYDLIPPRYRSAYFTHTFGGGYDAGYYSYVWAEVVAAEIEHWFRTVGAENGDGGLNRAAGEKVRRELLGRGSSRPEMDSVRAVLGRDPEPAAVLRRRGLN
ncbi:M3 family metallopeptidase [Canibacter oris]|uniref:Peptidyl-dipeptidase Dcp n=1 Tax=Canibacter oris TaxID=1365628 RepID=A0A840DPR0_9MICO|nr:M3 family metallopeptidase [Canibacter oris]MBB4071539.1 peptidyl-dipeptidase Dcp [Canibacter oris]